MATRGYMAPLNLAGSSFPFSNTLG